MRCYVLMGVSGCGKSSVGTALQALCGMTFVDADERGGVIDIARPHAQVIAQSEAYVRDTII